MKKLLALFVGAALLLAACAGDYSERLDELDAALEQAEVLLAAGGGEQDLDALGMSLEDFVMTVAGKTNTASEESYIMDMAMFMSMDMMGVSLMDMSMFVHTQSVSEDGEVVGYFMESLVFTELIGEVMEEYSHLFFRDGWLYTYADGETDRVQGSFEDALLGFAGMPGLDMDLEDMMGDVDLDGAVTFTALYLADDAIFVDFDADTAFFTDFIDDVLGGDLLDDMFGELDDFGMDLDLYFDMLFLSGTIVISYDGYIYGIIVDTALLMEMEDIIVFEFGLGLTLVLEFLQLGGVVIDFPAGLEDY